MTASEILQHWRSTASHPAMRNTATSRSPQSSVTVSPPAATRTERQRTPTAPRSQRLCLPAPLRCHHLARRHTAHRQNQQPGKIRCLECPGAGARHPAYLVRDGEQRDLLFAGSHDGKMQNFVTPAAFYVVRQKAWKPIIPSSSSTAACRSQLPASTPTTTTSSPRRASCFNARRSASRRIQTPAHSPPPAQQPSSAQHKWHPP